MGAGKKIWGYYPVGNVWLPIICDATGRLVVDLTNVDLCDLGDVACAGLAAGDVLIRAAAAWNNLGIGAAGQRLEVVAGAPAWAWPDNLENVAGQILTSSAAGIVSLPRQSTFRAWRWGNQLIPNAAFTRVQFNGEDWDVQNEYDPAVNYRFTATEDGKYLATSTCRWINLPGLTEWYALFILNGIVPLSLGDALSGNAVSNESAHVTDVVDMSAGDTLEAWVWQNSGGALNLQSGGMYTWFAMHKLS